MSTSTTLGETVSWLSYDVLFRLRVTHIVDTDLFILHKGIVRDGFTGHFFFRQLVVSARRT